jgi:HK97 family phage prohead protease
MPILEIEGYASIFGILDDNLRIFVPGWAGSFLASNPDLSVPLLWHHRDSWQGVPIGLASGFEEDEIGLRFGRGEIADTGDGRDAAEIMRAFGQLGSSFHFFNGEGFLDEAFNTIVESAEFDEVSIMSPGRQANKLATAGIAGEFTSPAVEYMQTIEAVRKAMELVTAA